MIKPYYQKGDITIYHGDCLEILPQLDKVDLVLITDPPYGIDYNPQRLSDMNIAKGSKSNKSNEKVANDNGNIDLSFLFNYKKRVIFGFPYIYDKEATGWIVWDKQPQVDWRGMSTPVEIASTTLRKGFDLIHCMWAGYLRDLENKTEVRHKHPTQKPQKVMKGIIDRFTNSNDTILDPFMGVGSTLVAAKLLNRKAIGIEIEEKYCEIAVKRLSQEVFEFN